MRLRLHALLTVLVLLLAGCSGDAEPSADPSPSETPSSSSTPAPRESAEPADDGPVDPCDLVSPADWKPFVSRDKHATTMETRELSLTMSSVYTCRIGNPFSGIASMTVGYSLGPVDWEALRKNTKPDILGGERTELSGIGDEAFYATNMISVQAFARSGDHTVAIQVYDRTSAGELAGLLGSLILEAEPAWQSHPVVLPEGCPATDDEALTDLLGPVAFARGGFYDADGRHAFCDYTGENGEMVRALATQYRPAAYAVVEDSVTGPAVGFVIDPAPGRVRSLYPGRSDHTWSVTTGAPDKRLKLYVSTEPDHLNQGRFHGTRAEALRFADRFAALIGREFRA